MSLQCSTICCKWSIKRRHNRPEPKKRNGIEWWKRQYACRIREINLLNTKYIYCFGEKCNNITIPNKYKWVICKNNVIVSNLLFYFLKLQRFLKCGRKWAKGAENQGTCLHRCMILYMYIKPVHKITNLNIKIVFLLGKCKMN